MPKIIPRVVDQLAEESAFLWQLRDAAVAEPHYLLADLARLDQRVEAQLDGLTDSGDAGWERVGAALESGQGGEAFAAAVYAIGLDNTGWFDSVVATAQAQPEAARGLISALGWLPFEQASPRIKSLLSDKSPPLRRMGLAAAACHRKNPGAAAIEAAIGSGDPSLKARALRATGELGLVDFQHALRANLKDKDPACRFWAAWSAALLVGQAEALAQLRDIAEAGGAFAERAAQLAARRLPAREARVWIKRLVKDLRQFRIAIVVASSLGDPEVVPFLIEQMKVPKLARAAGEALSTITGVHIDYDKLDGPWPEGFEAGPTEDPADDDVAMDRDFNLPWPDPDKVSAWWKAQQGRFAHGTRYLTGQPISQESAVHTLIHGYQRHRTAAAIELAILDPGKPLFEVRAPGFRQQRLLAK